MLQDMFDLQAIGSYVIFTFFTYLLICIFPFLQAWITKNSLVAVRMLKVLITSHALRISIGCNSPD